MTERPPAPARPRVRAGSGLLLIAVAALALQRGATRPWATVTTATGAQLLVSPIGLTQVGGGPGRECRWWPTAGSTELCAVATDAGNAMARVRRGYPLVVVAMWTTVLALFLNVLRVPPRQPWVAPLVTVLASAFAAAGIWSVAAAASALTALANRPLRFTEPGFYLVAGAALAIAVATALLANPPTGERSG